MKSTENKTRSSYSSYLHQQLKNNTFRKEWKETELEYVIARQIIDSRLMKKMSQRDLAMKLNTSQAVVARMEGMTANPTLRMLKKTAEALGMKLEVKFV